MSVEVYPVKREKDVRADERCKVIKEIRPLVLALRRIHDHCIDADCDGGCAARMQEDAALAFAQALGDDWTWETLAASLLAPEGEGGPLENDEVRQAFEEARPDLDAFKAKLATPPSPEQARAGDGYEILVVPYRSRDRRPNGGPWLVRCYDRTGRHVHSAEGGVSLHGGLREVERAIATDEEGSTNG